MGSIAFWEQSTHNAFPYELYEFTVFGGTDRYYTSAGFDITGFSVGTLRNTYTAIPISRGPIASQLLDPSPLAIRVPADEAIAVEFLGSLPPAVCGVVVRRTHSRTPTKTNTQIIWRGNVLGVAARGNTATISVSNRLGSALRRVIPNRRFQPHCNHVLGDDRCTVDLSSFQDAATVSTVDGRTVTLTGLSPSTDGLYNGGVVTRDTDGEQRTIINQVGQVLTLLHPFRALSGSDAVTVTQGCDHARETCRVKFSNLVHFGGFADIPPGDGYKNGVTGSGGAK
jgi:uncharacterized phage protein (TIGR02218 family)